MSTVKKYNWNEIDNIEVKWVKWPDILKYIVQERNKEKKKIKVGFEAGWNKRNTDYSANVEYTKVTRERHYQQWEEENDKAGG